MDQISLLEKTRDYIKFPIRKITPNEDLLNRFQEHILEDVLF